MNEWHMFFLQFWYKGLYYNLLLMRSIRLMLITMSQFIPFPCPLLPISVLQKLLYNIIWHNHGAIWQRQSLLNGMRFWLYNCSMQFHEVILKHLINDCFLCHHLNYINTRQVEYEFSVFSCYVRLNIIKNICPWCIQVMGTLYLITTIHKHYFVQLLN